MPSDDPLTDSRWPRQTRQVERKLKAQANIGHRCRWQDEGWGTIVSVQIRGGWPFYVVEWDEGTPEWWGFVVSASHGSDFHIA